MCILCHFIVIIVSADNWEHALCPALAYFRRTLRNSHVIFCGQTNERHFPAQLGFGLKYRWLTVQFGIQFWFFWHKQPAGSVEMLHDRCKWSLKVSRDCGAWCVPVWWRLIDVAQSTSDGLPRWSGARCVWWAVTDHDLEFYWTEIIRSQICRRGISPRCMRDGWRVGDRVGGRDSGQNRAHQGADINASRRTPRESFIKLSSPTNVDSMNCESEGHCKSLKLSATFHCAHFLMWRGFSPVNSTNISPCSTCRPHSPSPGHDIKSARCIEKKLYFKISVYGTNDLLLQ